MVTFFIPPMKSMEELFEEAITKYKLDDIPDEARTLFKAAFMAGGNSLLNELVDKGMVQREHEMAILHHAKATLDSTFEMLKELHRD